MASDDPMLDDHQETWSAFVKGTVVVTVAVIAIVAAMAIFLL